MTMHCSFGDQSSLLHFSVGERSSGSEEKFRIECNMKIIWAIATTVWCVSVLCDASQIVKLPLQGNPQEVYDPEGEQLGAKHSPATDNIATLVNPTQLQQEGEKAKRHLTDLTEVTVSIDLDDVVHGTDIIDPVLVNLKSHLLRTHGQVNRSAAIVESPSAVMTEKFKRSPRAVHSANYSVEVDFDDTKLEVKLAPHLVQVMFNGNPFDVRYDDLSFAVTFTEMELEIFYIKMPLEVNVGADKCEVTLEDGMVYEVDFTGSPFKNRKQYTTGLMEGNPAHDVQDPTPRNHVRREVVW